MSMDQERFGRFDAEAEVEQATPTRNRLISTQRSFSNIVLFINEMRKRVNLFFGKRLIPKRKY